MKYSDVDIDFYQHNTKRLMLGYEPDFKDDRTHITHRQEFRDKNLAFIKDMVSKSPCRVIEKHSYRAAYPHVLTIRDEDKYDREFGSCDLVIKEEYILTPDDLIDLILKELRHHYNADINDTNLSFSWEEDESPDGVILKMSRNFQ